MIKLDDTARKRLEVLEWTAVNLVGPVYEWGNCLDLDRSLVSFRWDRPWTPINEPLPANFHEVISWLLSEAPEDRGTGRTTLLGLAAVRMTMRHPGEMFHIRDHIKPIAGCDFAALPVVKEMVAEVSELENREFVFKRTDAMGAQYWLVCKK